jgi:hypothetical protein
MGADVMKVVPVSEQYKIRIMDKMILAVTI